MIILLVIALIVIGPQKLPELARSVGRGMREFRAALSAEGDDRRHDPYEDEDDEDDGDASNA